MNIAIERIEEFCTLLSKKRNSIVEKKSTQRFIRASKQFIKNNNKEDVYLYLNQRSVNEGISFDNFLKLWKNKRFIVVVQNTKQRLNLNLKKNIDEVSKVLQQIDNLDETIFNNQKFDLFREFENKTLTKDDIIKEDLKYSFLASRLSEKARNNIVELYDYCLKEETIILDNFFNTEF